MMDSSSSGITHQFVTTSQKEEALEHLASIDLLELCKEAKVERCRAAKDISSCGRYVQHVLRSCGHASLCVECSQRCDVCPLCRNPLPRNGNRVQLRLYNECMEAGLFSKKSDDYSQDKEDDISRLYSLFDVALENNLVSLICHYVTDVCMDESAISSDPFLAFLLDEVVVKDWCKRTFQIIIEDLCSIYALKTEKMQKKLGILLKYVSRLTGISCVIDVLESAFKETLSAQLHDLHCFSENILKAKQHLEVLAWCARHYFLENIQARYSNYELWHSDVLERKSSATSYSWPTFFCSSAESVELNDSSLFIEDALLNLGLDEVYDDAMQEECGVLSLEKSRGYPIVFSSKIEGSVGCYPFESVRAAVDILFLRGSSDMGVAKRAIFLYYLFDRHWTVPDAEWRHLVDDFAANFDISKHSTLESLVFYLLDDGSEKALQEACCLLPRIACTTTHPKIAQVLVERQKPDAALLVLRCSGRDGLHAFATNENGDAQLISLHEAVTAVRVRVECGLLTEAFMYQRTYCMEVKDGEWKHVSTLPHDSVMGCRRWMEPMEVLVTEICCLCIRRKLVEHMIELPWNSEEEKYIHRCLFDNASDDPLSTSGSLLVVFYLQRYRYLEAYQIDRQLRNVEDSLIASSTNVDVSSRIRSIVLKRASLIEKCIGLLPEVQQQRLKTGDITDSSLRRDFDSPAKGEFFGVQSNISSDFQTSSPINSSVVFGLNLPPPSKKTSDSFTLKRSLELNLNNYGTPSGLHGKILSSVKRPSIPGLKGASCFESFTSRSQDRDNLSSYKHPAIGRNRHVSMMQERQYDNSANSSESYLVDSLATPLKELNRSDARAHKDSKPMSSFFHAEKFPPGIETNGSLNRVENSHSIMLKRIARYRNEEMESPVSNFSSGDLTRSSNPTMIDKEDTTDGPRNVGTSDEAMDFSWSISKQALAQDLNNSSLRWRSDETSEDEEDITPTKYMVRSSVAAPVVRSRGRRRRW